MESAQLKEGEEVKKKGKKKKQVVVAVAVQRSEEEEKELFSKTEEDNARLFETIDQLHLSHLEEVIVKSQQKMKSLLMNLQAIGVRLEGLSSDIKGDIASQEEEDTVVMQLHENKMDSVGIHQSLKECDASEMKSQTAVEDQQPPPKLTKNSDLNLAKMKELVASQRRFLDSLENSVREIVSKINTSALGEMNIKGKQPLEDLFELLFELLYNEDREKFVWKVFKQSILLNEQGSADFLARMANIELLSISEPRLSMIKKTKDSCDLRVYLEDPKTGEYLIDIADWLEFLFHGHSLAKELHMIEEQYGEAKLMVETQERDQRRDNYILNAKETFAAEQKNTQEFLSFVADKCSLMRQNYEKSSTKLQNHVVYSAELLKHVLQQEILKNQPIPQGGGRGGAQAANDNKLLQQKHKSHITLNPLG